MKTALRSLCRTPGFTAIAVPTLALGIGASTALVSTFNGFVLHPLNLSQPDRLVRIWVTNPALDYNGRYLSGPRYEFLRDHQTSFSTIAAASFARYALTRSGADPEQLNSLQVSTNVFPR